MCVDSWIFDGEMHYPNVSQSAPALVRSSSLTVICPWHGQSVPRSILGGTQCKQWFNAPSSSGRLLCHLPAWHIKLGGKQAMLENICLFFFFHSDEHENNRIFFFFENIWVLSVASWRCHFYHVYTYAFDIMMESLNYLLLWQMARFVINSDCENPPASWWIIHQETSWPITV